MGNTVEVELPRLPERDELLHALEAQGIDARAVDADDHIGIEVPCGEDADRTCDEIVHQLDAWVSATGLPLVPVKANGHVYLRPPGS